MIRSIRAMVLAALVVPMAAAAAPPVLQCPAPQTSYETATVAFTLVASDPDGDPVELEAIALPRRATFDPPSGMFQWTSDRLQAGSYVLEFRAIAAGDTTTCSVPVTIENLNQLPRVTCPPEVVAVQGDTIRVRFVGIDYDNEPLQYTMTPMPAGATLGGDGWLVWPTEGAAPGTHDFAIEVTDGTSTASCSWRAILVTESSMPHIYCPTPRQVMETRALAFDVVAEAELGPLTLAAFDLPAGSAFNPQTGTFTWTPQEGQAGAYTPAFVATNPYGFADTCRTEIDVTVRVVAPPTITCMPPYENVELRAFQIQIGVDDPEDLPVTLSASALPPGATFNATTRRISWTPARGQAGTYDVLVTATNGYASSSCTQRIVVIDPVFDVPTMTCQPAREVLAWELTTIQILAQDPYGLPLTVSASPLPPGATFNSTSRRISWRPGPEQLGTYDIVVNATNGYASSSCTQRIVVADRVFDPPTITCQPTLEVLEADNISIVIFVQDPVGLPVTVTAAPLPAGATFNPTTRRIAWKPGLDQSGAYDIVIAATNGYATSSCAQRIVVLDRLAAAPPTILCPPAQTGSERNWIHFLVRATDPIGLPIRGVAENLPNGATFDSETGWFDWIPGPAQAGVYTPAFRADNGLAVSVPCTVEVTVLDRPVSAPVLLCPESVLALEGRETIVQFTASDPEQDSLTWSVHGLPAGAEFLRSPDFKHRYVFWTPDSTRAGEYGIDVLVTDGEASDSCSVKITVLDHAGTVQPYEPVVLHADDVPDDQGGYVRLEFLPAPRDVQRYADVTGYNVWRRLGPAGGAASAPLSPASTEGLRTFPPGQWETVAFAPAVQARLMHVIAAARRDSSATGVSPEVYVVSAHTANPSVWYVSEPESAYSVDNLPPPAPSLRLAESSVAPGALQLSWSAVDAVDLARFEVHRGAAAGFVASDGTRLATTEDTTWIDHAPVPDTWYRVLARDINGNASASSDVPAVGGGGAGTIALGAPRPSPTTGGIEASFELDVRRHVRLVILDARGRRVRTLLDEERDAGPHAVRWDGRDDGGSDARAGVYFLRMESDAGSSSRKFVRLTSTAAAGL